MSASSINVNAVAAVLDSIKLEPKAHSSINYAKARCTIEETSFNRAEKRLAKMTVVEALHGQVIHPTKQASQKTAPPNFVQFPDNTKARF